MHRIGYPTLLVVLLPLVNAPGQQPAKPPVYPPINPAAARLDQTMAGLDGPGFAIAYSETRETVIAACERGTIQIWKKDVLVGIRAGSGSANGFKGHDGPVLALAWNDGAILASAGLDRKVQIWDFTEGKIVHSMTSSFLPRTLALAPDSKLLAAAGEDPAIQLWDTETAKPGLKLSDHADWIESLAFSPDGKLLASGDHGGKVCLWEMPAGKKLRNLPAPPMPPPKVASDPWPASALAFSPDSKLLALGEGNGTIQLVNPADGKIVRSLPGHTSAVTGLAWHPTGTLLVSSSRDRTVRLWNPVNGQAIKTLEGHTAWVEGVVFLFRGTRLASIGADQTVRVWDLTDVPKK